jgi:hypothetical protein
MTTDICHGDAVFCEVGTQFIKILLRITSGIKGIITTTRSRSSKRQFYPDVPLMKINVWLHVTSYVSINYCD